MCEMCVCVRCVCVWRGEGRGGGKRYIRDGVCVEGGGGGKRYIRDGVCGVCGVCVEGGGGRRETHIRITVSMLPHATSGWTTNVL